MLNRQKSSFTYITLHQGRGLEINLNSVISFELKAKKLTLQGYSSPLILGHHSAIQLQKAIDLYAC